MALKIKSTPKLNKKDSVEFIRRVESKASVVSHPIPTPELTKFAKKLVRDAAQMPQKSHQ